MQYTQLESVYFSATGTTKCVAEAMCKELNGPCMEHDFLRHPLTQPLHLSATSLAIVAMPVYAGRIPQYAMQNLAMVTGQQTPAIAVVVYGNRHYDDALLELKITLEGNGFVVLGAAAFVAQHSMFPEVGNARPDAADMRSIAGFSYRCKQKLKQLRDIEQAQRIQVPGNTPYKDAKAVALKPTIDDSCTLCGACADICPVQAITVGTKYFKDEALCFSCAACIAACPTHSQAFRGPEYEALKPVFCEKYAARREPEFFL